MDTSERRSQDVPEVQESVLGQTEEKVIPYGYCHCGYGGKTNIATQNQSRNKWTKGEPLKTLRGHNKPNNGTTVRRGYNMILMPNHHRADTRGYVLVSILMAEKALGKDLPLNSVVHHADGNKGNDSKGNHVICQDNEYHQLLHIRMRALRECGHASWRKCWICKKYDFPENLIFGTNNIYHKHCRAIYYKQWQLKRQKNA